MRILLGVSAGIAAYKSVHLLRLLKEAGHSVRVLPTATSLEFVGRATWEALSGEPVTERVFEDVPDVAHVRIGQGADLMIVAPATADLMARAATGRADDLLTATLLTVRCPVLFAPAMHTEMWHHSATRANVATLRDRGVTVLDPAVGRLTGADSGPGRLPEPEEIAAVALALGPDARSAAAPQDLAGRRVVISAGGTQEPLDPVRFLGNRSSGRQGVALAEAARARGAEVHLVAANLLVPAPDNMTVTHVGSALELRDAVRTAAAQADVVVMAAAVADFRPQDVPGTKIKKVAGSAPPTITLVENPDILAELAHDRLRADQVVVGFAAETGDAENTVLALGQAKARRKAADLLVVNDVSGGKTFGASDSAVHVLDAAGEVLAEATGTKRDVADVILDAVVPLLVRP